MLEVHTVSQHASVELKAIYDTVRPERFRVSVGRGKTKKKKELEKMRRTATHWMHEKRGVPRCFSH